MSGTEKVVEHKQGGVKPGEARVKKQKSQSNLKLRKMGSVEIQAQPGPDRMKTDRLGPNRIGEPDPRGAGRPLEPTLLG